MLLVLVILGIKYDPYRPSRSYTVSLADEPYNAMLTSIDFGGDAEIVFDGYGTPHTGGVVSVGVGSHVKTLVVDTITGRASSS